MWRKVPWLKVVVLAQSIAICWLAFKTNGVEGSVDDLAYNIENVQKKVDDVSMSLVLAAAESASKFSEISDSIESVEFQQSRAKASIDEIRLRLRLD